MYNTNVTNARANLYDLVNMAIDDSEVINISSKESIVKIADYLDCSVDYLLGRTNNPEINK